jgi:hypothetical protein
MPESSPKPLPGAVCPQWVRCGNHTCHCARGELHGPYYYRFWHEGGRRRKQYVRREQVEEVRARCQARREARRELQEWRQMWRDMAALLKEVEQR